MSESQSGQTRRCISCADRKALFFASIAALLLAMWAGLSYALGVTAAAVVPQPRPSVVPSFHCLMQFMRCMP